MPNNEVDIAQIRQRIADAVTAPDFRRATFGGAVRGNTSCPWIRVVVRTIELRGERCLQFSYFDQKKNITKNLRGQEVAGALGELLDAGFARIHLATGTEELDIQITRKGKILVGRRELQATPDVPSLAHNRVKDVPLPEGRADHLLEVLGIATRNGQIRPTMRAKFTQINEFLRQLTAVLDDAGLRTLGRPVEILDCACGSSYLTFAVHHYLNDVLAIPAKILGVDVNDEVIRKSIERSERLGTEHLELSCGTIDTLAVKPDIVLALHACDTATDDAIALAVSSGARILLSVPCCHHHLHDAVRPQGPAGVLRPLLRHGILKQRAADLLTDSFRALLLRIMGYRTDVIEFISSEHTARNLMIRAVAGARAGEPAFVNEYLEMKSFWGVTPYLEGALGADLQALLAPSSAATSLDGL